MSQPVDGWRRREVLLWHRMYSNRANRLSRHKKREKTWHVTRRNDAQTKCDSSLIAIQTQCIIPVHIVCTVTFHFFFLLHRGHATMKNISLSLVWLSYNILLYIHNVHILIVFARSCTVVLIRSQPSSSHDIHFVCVLFCTRRTRMQSAVGTMVVVSCDDECMYRLTADKCCECDRCGNKCRHYVYYIVGAILLMRGHDGCGSVLKCAIFAATANSKSNYIVKCIHCGRSL